MQVGSAVSARQALTDLVFGQEEVHIKNKRLGFGYASFVEGCYRVFGELVITETKRPRLPVILSPVKRSHILLTVCPESQGVPLSKQERITTFTSTEPDLFGAIGEFTAHVLRSRHGVGEKA